MFSRTRIAVSSAALLLIIGGLLSMKAAGSKYTVVAWNDLGMHCVDGNDYSVFSILPPYNNLHAQVIDSNGKLLKSPGSLTITYQAAADPTGSINRTSASKTNFWKYVLPLFGVTLTSDMGLAGYGMPGRLNTPQPMGFDATNNYFFAQGVPILPYDDKNLKNYYPLMKVAVKSGTTVLASTKAVLPVSDEMDCSACHASGSVSAAEPSSGWVYDSNPTKDFKRNILRLHDERKPASAAMLTWAGYKTGGLEATYKPGTPILCAKCHLSNALGTTGYSGVPALTTSVHSAHVNAVDPTTGLTLGSDANRDACYRCHPGSTTKCLRGIMGSALNPDGTNMMQCQSCHGLLGAVGASTRQGWLDEPNCQACHTGTAVRNSGQIPSPRRWTHPAICAFRRTRPSRQHRTRPPRLTRCTNCRPATGDCNARPATIRPTPKCRAWTRTITCRASPSRATPGPWSSARLVMPRHRWRTTADRTGCTRSGRVGYRRTATPWRAAGRAVARTVTGPITKEPCSRPLSRIGLLASNREPSTLRRVRR